MNQARPKLFVVDDDESVCKALRRLFHCVGMATETFCSAEDFLERSNPDSSCCIILDVRLPGMSGLELHARLLAEGRAMQVVYITGDMDETIRDKAVAQGAVDFISKPFKEKTMLDAVSKAFPVVSRDGV